ncbi:permease [Geitlerinema sp. PCC 9228]|uniref:permease n=1 Tax=Geitlerinema sp. PCC 9228 TaxID=111611 RepID=UPI0008F9BAF7|nr:permease [Geitlerinema sp. PCC 9228]
MNQLSRGFTIFLSLLVEAIPFLLLGVLLSSFLLIFVDERKLMKSLPGNPIFGAFAGSLIGFLFPVCECGNVPVARRLISQGISPAVAVGFLLAAPTVNPIVIWSTWVAFRDQPQIVLLRVVFSLVIATAIGAIFSIQKDFRPLLQPTVARMLQRNSTQAFNRNQTNAKNPVSTQLPAKAPVPTLLQSGTYWLGQNHPGIPAANPVPAKPLPGTRAQLFWENTIGELRELGGILILGSAIAAFVQVAVPREIILSLGQNPVSSIMAMLLLGTVVSICSTVDAFFALSFASTFTSGSLLAFLVFGPMVDLKGIGLMLSVFRGRIVAYLFLLAAQLTFLLALGVNLYLS